MDDIEVRQPKSPSPRASIERRALGASHGFDRRFHLALLSECDGHCNLCDALGCLAPRPLAWDEILSAMDDAKSTLHSHVVFPPNVQNHARLTDLATEATARGLHPVFCVRSADFKGKRRSALRRLASSGASFELFVSSPIDDESLEAIMAVQPAMSRLTAVFVPSREHDPGILIESLPGPLQQELQIFAPLRSTDSDPFFDPDELSFWLERARRQHPSLTLRPYQEFDRLHPEAGPNSDRSFGAEYVYQHLTNSSEIRVSVVIAFRDHDSHLFTCLDQLANQTLVPSRFEVILVQDQPESSMRDTETAMARTGGLELGLEPEPDLTLTLLNKWAERTAPHLNFSVLRLDALAQAGNETLGFKFAPFRAGPARNAGAAHARGDRLVFLDESTLVPPTFLEDVLSANDSADIIQYRQLVLRSPQEDSVQLEDESAYEPLRNAKASKVSELLYSGTPWQDLPDKWKHLCAVCFSVRTQVFLSAGGFARSFAAHPYEAAFLGWRMEALGATWSARLFNVYSLENNKGIIKKEELRYSMRAAQAFYLSTLDSNVYRVYYTAMGESWIGRWLLKALATFPPSRLVLVALQFALSLLIDYERRRR